MHDDYPKNINSVIAENFEWWNYVQRCAGYGSLTPPVIQKPLPPDRQLQHMALEIQYLIDRYEVFKATAGILIQERLPLDVCSCHGQAHRMGLPVRNGGK